MNDDNLTDRFIGALLEAEETHNPEPLVELFSEDCRLSNLGSRSPAEGREGARQFWYEYLSFFQDVHSEFTHVMESDEIIVLEWNSKAILRTGSETSYRGVSILETDGNQIREFRSYYDSAVFKNLKPAERSNHDENKVEEDPAVQISS